MTTEYWVTNACAYSSKKEKIACVYLSFLIVRLDCSFLFYDDARSIGI